jgi:serine/threonine protein kinase
MANQDPLFTDLVRSLLKFEPEQRIDAHKALQHEFFQQCELRPSFTSSNTRSKPVYTAHTPDSVSSHGRGCFKIFRAFCCG